MLVPKPTIAFLSFSSDDIQRARALIDGFRGEGVLDELGFGPLQSAFADRFYPATNTIMTRSRYLFLVPAVYRYVERTQSRAPRDVETLVRTKQDELREELAKQEPLGVVGRDAKLNVQRLPSNIYWSALRDLEIFRIPLAERTYQSQLAEPKRNHPVSEDDDGRKLVIDGSLTLWDTSFPVQDLRDTDHKFPPGTSFLLTRAEATELRKRFRKLDEAKGLGASLLTQLVDTHQAWWPAELVAPWGTRDLTESLDVAVAHAEALSVLARGVILQYHHMLLEARPGYGIKPLDADVRPDFEAWWSAARDHLAHWDLDAFGAQLAAIGRTSLLAEIPFLRAWRDAYLTSSGAGALLDSPLIQAFVRRREHQKRPRKARLRSKHYLEQWKPRQSYEGLHELHYRHAVGFRFVSDIVEGLRGKVV